MRPISLKIAGLHSYREEQVIPFEQLTDAGVFGIFGPTGSGKSSILDAITLALYGKVERAVSGTRGIINEVEKRAFVSFVFELGVGEQAQRYRVERRYDRSKEGRVHNGYSRLVRYTPDGEVVLADRDRQVTEQIVSLLGLTVDDFTRAVVLPQGKFAEFLTLSGAARRQMLQRLFSLQRYGDQLLERVDQRRQQVAHLLQGVVGAQQELGDASLEQLQQVEQQLQEAIRAEEEARQAVQQAEQALEEARRIREWQQEYEQLSNRWSQLQQQWPEVHQCEARLERARQAEALRPLLEQLQEARQQAHQLLQERAQLEVAKAAAVARQQSLQQQWAALVERRDARMPALQQKKAELERALALEEEMRQLEGEATALRREVEQHQLDRQQLEQELQQWSQSEEEITQRLAQLAQELQEHAVPAAMRRQVEEALRAVESWQLAHQRCRQLEQELLHRQQELQQLQEELSACARHQELLLVEEQQLKHRLSGMPDVTQWEIRLGQQKGLRERWQQVREEMAQLGAQLEKRSREHAQAAEQLRDCRAREEQLRLLLLAAEEELARAKAILAKAEQLQQQRWAHALAQQLVEGQPCPVCGSTSHPSPLQLEEEGGNHLREAQERVRQAEMGWQKLQQEYSEARLDTVRQEGLCQQLQQGMAELHEQLEQLNRDLPDEEELQRFEQERVQLEQAKAHKAALEEQLRQLQQQLADVREQESRLQGRHQALLQEVEKAAQLLYQAQREERAAQTVREEALRGLGGADPHALQEEIARHDRLAEALREEEQALRSRLATLHSQLLPLQEQQRSLERELIRLTARMEGMENQLGALRDQWSPLTGGQPAAPQLQQALEQIQKLSEEERALQQSLQEADREAILASQRLEQSLRAEAEAIRRLQGVENRARSAWQGAGFASREEALAAILGEQEQQQLSEWLRQFHQSYTLTKERREELARLLDGRSISQEQWEELWQQGQEAQQRLEKALEYKGQLRREQENLAERHARWKELEKQRVQLQHRHDQLAELRSLLRGNAFVEFLAQEQMNLIARFASERLKRLTQGRYALEVASDGGFVIRDDANGGLRRSVTTLSGGETFLASLALALSLSAQIQLRGRYPLQFFFLDEGFGTLDPEMLDMALSTLEGLHQEHMSIGLISHVPELRARVQRRILVTPAQPAGEGSRIRVEKA